MATFTIVTNSGINNPPYQTGTLYIEVDYNGTYVFTKDDFTINTIPEYKDPEDDDLLKIKIIIGPSATLPNGSLLYKGSPAVIGTEILVADIINGDLTYAADPAFESSYTDIFFFDVADEGSEEYGGLQGAIKILTGEKVNLPPSEVGDGEETIEYGETLVFTPDMFTVDTLPPYSDPENDAAYLLKIVILPEEGSIKLSGIDVTAGQIIPFTSIANGELVYVSDNSNELSSNIQSFEFQIADEGSNQFVS